MIASCNASSGATVWHIKRSRTARCPVGCENPLYHFKGARSAPCRGSPPRMQERRAAAALAGKRRCVRPQLAGHQGGPWRAGASAAFLWPFGPRRRRRALSPAANRTGSAPQRQRWRAMLQTGPSLRRPHSEALRAHGQERSLRSRGCAIPSGLWTAAPQGFRGAYRRDG
jgi:hypothetical protein